MDPTGETDERGVMITRLPSSSGKLPQHAQPSLQEALQHAGVDLGSPDRLLNTLPFGRQDTTAGSESELQVAVRGSRHAVDLPQTIEASRYMTNLLKRARSGDSPDRLASALENYLTDNSQGVWENSFVRFPARTLTPSVRALLDADLMADKRAQAVGQRSDAHRFLCENKNGEAQVRVPVSYLLKLSLADVIGRERGPSTLIAVTGQALLGHFLNDNTSPETHSFHVVPLTPEAGLGAALARESARRHLLTDLLVRYANQRFELARNGQEALIYFAPHPPQRQKELNGIIPDSFYRELFMSPCLSGWDRGEEKHRYMHLCHQTLSRSQINAVAKLREAGIIANNLVTLPTLSNTSLANNGVHISLGSRRLTTSLADAGSAFSSGHEKLLGDLVIKITEHFLPLFVGSYTAAPFRLGFTDFHPEKALGFLPHELDYTHLRMLWRRWRKKADLSIFGQSLTPFGPEWLDSSANRLFGLRGDFVPDFRVLDYPVCFLSTERSPAFDGRLGNHVQLKEDLAEMGVTDRQMSLYLFLKPREFAAMGFSGMEGRHYSVFEGFCRDMGQAASLQNLVTAFAYHLIATGKVTHADIPDDPVTESERRQIFFGTAINLPTFFVRADTPNRFLQRILGRTRQTRGSNRYPGYQRVPHHEYRLALLHTLREEASGLVEALGLAALLDDLGHRLNDPEHFSAAGRLTKGVLESLGARDPMAVDHGEFNRAAEAYYRQTLSRQHLGEAMDLLIEDLHRAGREGDEMGRELLRQSIVGERGVDFLRQAKADLLAGEIEREQLLDLIRVVILTIHRDALGSANILEDSAQHVDHTSIYCAL